MGSHKLNSTIFHTCILDRFPFPYEIESYFIFVMLVPGSQERSSSEYAKQILLQDFYPIVPP